MDGQNLTEFSEFTEGRRIRLVSYMGPDIVIGRHSDEFRPDLWGGGPGISWPSISAAVKARANDPEQIFRIVDVQGDSFSLQSTADNQSRLFWNGENEMLYADPTQITAFDQRFKIDFIGAKVWFALNTSDKSRVADIGNLDTNIDNPILCWGWNSGENQIWRAESV